MAFDWTQSVRDAAQCWEYYAARCERSIARRGAYCWAAQQIGDTGWDRGEISRRRAKTLFLQADTGKQHCMCCFLPKNECSTNDIWDHIIDEFDQLY